MVGEAPDASRGKLTPRRKIEGARSPLAASEAWLLRGALPAAPRSFQAELVKRGKTPSRRKSWHKPSVRRLRLQGSTLPSGHARVADQPGGASISAGGSPQHTKTNKGWICGCKRRREAGGGFPSVGGQKWLHYPRLPDCFRGFAASSLRVGWGAGNSPRRAPHLLKQAAPPGSEPRKG